jgi:hypothetical protein
MILGMPGDTPAEASVEIFCSYSHKDEPLRREFETHVTMMRRQNLVQIWHDRQVVAGDDWAGEIDQHLNTADIVTLFVSSDFLASDYCYERELARAMERLAHKETLVVPIIVRPCDWHEAPFGQLQAIPTEARPVTRWPDRDEAWTDVALHLKVTVKEVLQRIQAKLSAELLAPMQVPAPSPARGPVELPKATRCGEILSDQQKAKHQEQMLRWQILQDAQRKIMEIQQEVTANQGATLDRTYKKWEEYIRQA